MFKKHTTIKSITYMSDPKDVEGVELVAEYPEGIILSMEDGVEFLINASRIKPKEDNSDSRKEGAQVV